LFTTKVNWWTNTDLGTQQGNYQIKQVNQPSKDTSTQAAHV